MSLGFEEKQFDGPYEVAGVDLRVDEELFKGVLYSPPEEFEKPYPLILYFHGFPQLFTLPEIVKKFRFLLDLGYAFLVFNFRGYKYCQGKVSIRSQVADGLQIVDFVKQMGEHGIFDLGNINLIGQDFGAYIATILCSKTELINKLALLNPIIDLKRHINDTNFKATLEYINKFLPGCVKGIENVESFIEMTKKELEMPEFQIDQALSNLKVNQLKIILGERDKVTPLSELDIIKTKSKIKPQVIQIEDMDHEFFTEEEIEVLHSELTKFLKS